MVPFPQWTFWHSAVRDVSGIAPGADVISTSDRTPATDSSPTIPGFKIIELYNALAGSVRTTVRYPASHGMSGWICAFAMMCAALGFVRLIWALSYLRRLYRDSIPLRSEQVVDIVHHLATALGVTQRYELRQCSRLLSPAVIGWRRPAILLPSAWSTWSDDQLRAALAHELAHISSRDSFTRLIATFADHRSFLSPPFVHWLAATVIVAGTGCGPSCRGRDRGRETLSLCDFPIGDLA